MDNGSRSNFKCNKYSLAVLKVYKISLFLYRVLNTHNYIVRYVIEFVWDGYSLTPKFSFCQGSNIPNFKDILCSH